MKALVVYDPVYGNTEKVAKAVAEGLSCETKILRAGEAGFSGLEAFGFLVVGSPTHAGRPSPP